MRAIIQRVSSAQVKVGDEIVGSIGPGLLTLLGVGHGDDEGRLEWMISKIVKLRIFEDEQGKMNQSLIDVGGEHLIVSQFTLFGDTRKGNRPSFVGAAKPEIARVLYEKSLELSRGHGIKTEGGRFQADMQVSLINEGPVTLLIDSETQGASEPNL